MKEKYPKIAEDLKIWRKEAGLTQKELAEKSGVSYSAICKYESGERYPREEQLDMIFEALGIEKSNVVINIKDDVSEVTKEDLVYIREEIIRIMDNLSPKYAVKFYSYALDLQRLDKMDKMDRLDKNENLKTKR